MKIRISRNKASLSSKINLFSCCIRVEKRDRALDILSGGKNRAISFNHFVNSSLISTSPYDSLQEWRTRSLLTSFLGSALDRQLLSNRRIAWKKAQKKKMKSSVRHGDRAVGVVFHERAFSTTNERKIVPSSRSSTCHCDDSNDAPCKLDGLQPDNGRLYANAIGFWQRRPIGFPPADQRGWTWGSTGCPFDTRLIVIETQGFSRLRLCFEARSSIGRFVCTVIEFRARFFQLLLPSWNWKRCAVWRLCIAR